MKCKLLQRMQQVVHPGTPDQAFVWLEEGHIHDEPDAFKLVQHGAAVPADEECRLAAGLTEEQAIHARKSYLRVSHGIQPEDYAAFDAGEMVGYFPDGSPKPGPNADVDDDDDLDFADEDEDDDDDETDDLEEDFPETVTTQEEES